MRVLSEFTSVSVTLLSLISAIVAVAPTRSFGSNSCRIQIEKVLDSYSRKASLNVKNVAIASVAAKQSVQKLLRTKFKESKPNAVFHGRYQVYHSNYHSKKGNKTVKALFNTNGTLLGVRTHAHGRTIYDCKTEALAVERRPAQFKVSSREAAKEDRRRDTLSF